MCGVANGGLAATPSSTRAHRCDPARNTASHECSPNGVPSSASHSHNGSSPASPCVNSSRRSSGSSESRLPFPARPRRSVQCSSRRARPVTFVTSQTSPSSS